MLDNMMDKKQMTCKTNSKKDILDEKIFNRELLLCQKLSQKNGGKCGWGTCKDCGVIPLLYKLHKGELLEDPKKIRRAKGSILSNLGDKD